MSQSTQIGSQSRFKVGPAFLPDRSIKQVCTSLEIDPPVPAISQPRRFWLQPDTRSAPLPPEVYDFGSKGLQVRALPGASGCE
jgi:hypothetical protein